MFPTQSPPSPARASRSDFFRNALAQVQAPATPMLAMTPPADTPVRSFTPAAEPDRLARPGSLLDIRI